METIRLIIWILVLLATIFFVGRSYGSEYPNINDVKFIHNYDGDTVTVDIEGYPDIIGKWIPIRVRGVDTPERRGKCFNEKALSMIVKNFVTQELTNAHEIRLVNVSRGKYFRIIADIWYDGKLLSKELIMRDYGYPYDGGKKENPWCK